MITHAILMPLKSNQKYPPEFWLNNFEESFKNIRNLKLYIGIDNDDLLWKNKDSLTVKNKISINFEVVLTPNNQNSGSVCKIWNNLAIKAYEDGCNGLFVLFGDDVKYINKTQNENWLQYIFEKYNGLYLFQPIDKFDNSCCTFPILPKSHLDIFKKLFPENFINQDADPFLWSLYRKLDSIKTDEIFVENYRGGVTKLFSNIKNRDKPLYKKKKISNTEFDKLLDNWCNILKNNNFSLIQSIDVIVPTYRCDITKLNLIKKICLLSNVFLIIQVDNPEKSYLIESLEDCNTRIRVNEYNIGAPATRNKGINESKADIIIFLDDDVKPNEDSIINIRNYLNSNKNVCGVIGNVIFPESKNIWHEGTRMSHILTPFNWPENLLKNFAPWGVTAFLCVYRKFNVNFDEEYSKTGGGEDVDYCLRVVKKSNLLFGRCNSYVIHEFWEIDNSILGIVKYLSHFWKWTQGDGLLLDKFKNHVYINYLNIIEITLLFPILSLFLKLGFENLIIFWVIEFLIEMNDSYNGSYALHLSWYNRIKSSFIAVIVKNIVDAGHTFYWIRRFKFKICYRFDWFTGMNNDIIKGEKNKYEFRWKIWIIFLALYQIFKLIKI